MQFADNVIHSLFQPGIPIAEILHSKFVHMVALHNGIHMGLNATAEKAAVILTGFHHYRKVCKLCRTVVNIQSINIILHYACHRFAGSITIGFINFHQHIEHIRKDMTGTGAWVNGFHLFRCQCCVFLVNLGKLCLYFRLLLSFFQIVMPFGIFQITLSGNIGRPFFLCRQKLILSIRVSLQPQTAKAVLYHVTNNPVRRKQLGSGRDILFCDFDILFQGSKHVVFFLTVVILIQPADNLHGILPVLLRYQLNHLLNHAAISQQVVRQKKLRVVADFLEHSRQNLIQSVALHNQQIFIQFFGLFSFFQFIDLFHIQSIQIQMNGFGNNLRFKIIFLICKYTHMGREIAVNLHETQGREAVKPSVGGLLHNLLVSFIVNLGYQSLTLFFLSIRQNSTAHAVRCNINNIVLCDTVFHAFQ